MTVSITQCSTNSEIDKEDIKKIKYIRLFVSSKKKQVIKQNMRDLEVLSILENLF